MIELASKAYASGYVLKVYLTTDQLVIIWRLEDGGGNAVQDFWGPGEIEALSLMT